MGSADIRVPPTKGGTEGFLNAQENGFDFNIPARFRFLDFKSGHVVMSLVKSFPAGVLDHACKVPFMLPVSETVRSTDHTLDFT